MVNVSKHKKIQEATSNKKTVYNPCIYHPGCWFVTNEGLVSDSQPKNMNILVATVTEWGGRNQVKPPVTSGPQK